MSHKIPGSFRVVENNSCWTCEFMKYMSYWEASFCIKHEFYIKDESHSICDEHELRIFHGKDKCEGKEEKENK